MLEADSYRCSLLLELPDKQEEQRFWQDADVLSVYSNWDAYIAINQIISNTLLIRVWWKALADMSVLRYTWHMHVNMLLNVIVTSVHVVYIRRRRSTYLRQRHRIVLAQRMLRLMHMLVSVYQSCEGLQEALARALDAEKVAAAAASAPTLRVAVLNLTRPLGLGPLITMSQGSWIFSTKWWLPLQVFTFLLGVAGSVAHQPCRMAADPSSALLLEPTCRAVSDWHHYIAASILGPMLLWLTPGRSITNAAACSGMAMAAKTLGWYAHASYGLLLPAAGFCTLEWRLKARWVQEQLGRQLVYGPFGWPRSECQPSTFASRLQRFLSWVLMTAAGLGLLWVGVTWLVPLLPPTFGGTAKCGGRTCADKGTCRSVACEGGLCSSPGHWTAAAMYLQMLFTLFGHIAVTNLMGG